MPGIVVDLPLRVLLFFALPHAPAPPPELQALLPPRWAALLFLRCALVQLLSPLLSRRLAALLDGTVSPLAAPFLLREGGLRELCARPLQGMLTLEVALSPATLTKLAGFEHKSLRFSSVVVRLSVYTTPFAPFWVAGVRVHDLRLAGECAEYSRVPSQEDIGILQALELTLRLEAWLHPWVNVLAPSLGCFQTPATLVPLTKVPCVRARRRRRGWRFHRCRGWAAARLRSCGRPWRRYSWCCGRFRLTRRSTRRLR